MRLLTVFGVAFVVIAHVSAQERSAQPSIRRTRPLITIVLGEPVLKELGLEKDSADFAEIRKWVEAMQKEIQDKTAGATPENAEKMVDIQSQIEARYDAELKNKLKPEQFARLQQIHWQVSGSRVITEPDVVNSLGITKDQLEKFTIWLSELDRMEKSLGEKMQAAQKQQREANSKGASLAEAQKKMREAADEWKKQREEHQKVLDQILTTEQADKFAALKGKPFAPDRSKSDYQPPPRRRVSIEVGGLMSLVLLEPIQKELGIAKDSPLIPEIQKLLERARREFQEITRQPGSIAVSHPQDVESGLRAKYDPELAKLLTPKQFTRLQQIYWQKSEGRAFLNADVVKQLSITSEQQTQLTAVNAEIAEKLVKILNDPKKEHGEVQNARQAILVERDKRWREIFTEEQQAKIAELKGAPFDLTQLRPQEGRGQ